MELTVFDCLDDHCFSYLINKLHLQDLFNFEQTCKELDARICAISKHNREEIDKIFIKDKIFIFSIKCSLNELKIQLVVNKFFKNPLFIDFISKYFEKVLDFSSTKSPLLDAKCFFLLEKYNFSHFGAKKFVDSYNETKNTDLLKIEDKFELIRMCPHLIPIAESLYDVLFKEFVPGIITFNKTHTPEDYNMNFDDREVQEYNCLFSLNRLFWMISEGQLSNCKLSKPYVYIDEQIKSFEKSLSKT